MRKDLISTPDKVASRMRAFMLGIQQWTYSYLEIDQIFEIISLSVIIK